MIASGGCRPDREQSTRDDGQPRLRIGIFATPRSGNMWVSSLLRSLYGLQNVFCPAWDEIPWGELPERCVVPLHLSPTPELIERLDRHEFRVLTIARHPLDVLISILHFCTTDFTTSSWFGGRCGNEDSIRGSLPSSPEFLDYATSPRARALMSITHDWWQVAGCHKLHYERLIADPQTEFAQLAAALEPVTAQAIRAAIHTNSFERTKPKVSNQHHWMGTPGHWKRFLPAPAARQIVAAHTARLELLNSCCEPDEALSAMQADLNWFALEIRTLREELSRTRMQLLDATARLSAVESFGDRVRHAVKQIKWLRDLVRQAIQRTQRHYVNAVRFLGWIRLPNVEPCSGDRALRDK